MLDSVCNGRKWIVLEQTHAGLISYKKWQTDCTLDFILKQISCKDNNRWEDTLLMASIRRVWPFARRWVSHKRFPGKALLAKLPCLTWAGGWVIQCVCEKYTDKEGRQTRPDQASGHEGNDTVPISPTQQSQLSPLLFFFVVMVKLRVFKHKVACLSPTQC